MYLETREGRAFQRHVIATCSFLAHQGWQLLLLREIVLASSSLPSCCLLVSDFGIITSFHSTSLHTVTGIMDTEEPKEKPSQHTCEVCNKAFPRSYNLERHKTSQSHLDMLQKSGRKGHYQPSSSINGESSGIDVFLNPNHWGERRYQCPACPKSYIRGGILERHLRKEHGIIIGFRPGNYHQQPHQDSPMPPATPQNGLQGANPAFQPIQTRQDRPVSDIQPSDLTNQYLTEPNPAFRPIQTPQDRPVSDIQPPDLANQYLMDPMTLDEVEREMTDTP
jgi:hypothetical protein